MSTFTKRHGTLTCDSCGDVVPSGWRSLTAHTAVHARHDQLTARAARVQAMGDETRCDTGGFEQSASVETDRLMEQNEPASAQTLTGSSTPLVTTRKEA